MERLHRGHASQVFGEEGLVAGAEEKLLIEPGTEHGHHDEAGDNDQREDAQGDEGELPAVGEHHREEDEQEG
ncbi:hypothetical protein SDC9_184628 [bioreactor metagenome]|uniref:Uncharacterized protein n=1 Tax=bioreactor metagenome TaxID=1076179 RepID=A0A645HFF1_9ZZZZ